jgi:hypothetical protein
MASTDANLGVLQAENSAISQDPWITQAARPEVVERFCNVLETATNSAGIALTHAIRLLILLPAMSCLAIAELLIRLDAQVAHTKLGVDRG